MNAATIAYMKTLVLEQKLRIERRMAGIKKIEDKNIGRIQAAKLDVNAEMNENALNELNQELEKNEADKAQKGEKAQA